MGILCSKSAPAPKVILVTGASSGIGKECALDLIKRGHIVYGAARRLDRMQDLVDKGGHAIAMDVMKEADIVAGVERIMKEQGKIDVLFNNAGYAVYGSVEDVPMDEARRQFEVNLFGVARLTQEVLPHMRKAMSGTIINMSSVGGKIYTPFGAWYHATKHAMEGWSDCLRLELNPFGIKVAIIEPGGIMTELGDATMTPLMERSKGGPYQDYVQNFVKNSETSMQQMSPPSVISDLVVKASESKNPKRRYVAGAFAKPLMFLRNWFGDGLMDAILLSQIRN